MKKAGGKISGTIETPIPEPGQQVDPVHNDAGATDPATECRDVLDGIGPYDEITKEQVQAIVTLEALDRFAYHKPDDKGVESIKCIRSTMQHTAATVMSHVPEGRERSIALTKLVEAMMWANAGIALQQPAVHERPSNAVYAAGRDEGT